MLAPKVYLVSCILSRQNGAIVLLLHKIQNRILIYIKSSRLAPNAGWSARGSSEGLVFAASAAVLLGKLPISAGGPGLEDLAAFAKPLGDIRVTGGANAVVPAGSVGAR